jgi:hypothetical protein
VTGFRVRVRSRSCLLPLSPPLSLPLALGIVLLRGVSVRDRGPWPVSGDRAGTRMLFAAADAAAATHGAAGILPVVGSLLRMRAVFARAGSPRHQGCWCSGTGTGTGTGSGSGKRCSQGTLLSDNRMAWLFLPQPLSLSLALSLSASWALVDAKCGWWRTTSARLAAFLIPCHPERACESRGPPLEVKGLHSIGHPGAGTATDSGHGPNRS